MKIVCYFFFGVLVLFGISKDSSASDENSPQKLIEKKYFVCGQSLDVEIADSPEERQKGLMFRSRIDEGRGMIFLFPFPQVLSFWMKNVPFDIDIGYFDSKGFLKHFETMKGTSLLMKTSKIPNYSSRVKVQIALEVVPGFFSRLSKDKLSACKIEPLDAFPKF
jgi:uncharacterized membrane protein (UPF0127 family)